MWHNNDIENKSLMNAWPIEVANGLYEWHISQSMDPGTKASSREKMREKIKHAAKSSCK